MPHMQQHTIKLNQDNNRFVIHLLVICAPKFYHQIAIILLNPSPHAQRSPLQPIADAVPLGFFSNSEKALFVPIA